MKENDLIVFNEIIKNQTAILGPQVAIWVAKSTPGIILDKGNNITKIAGDKDDVLNRLIEAYSGLSGEMMKKILMKVIEKYSNINKPI